MTDEEPIKILDEQTVRHIKEIPLKGRYGEGACDCGEHPIESETWYHKPLVLTEDHTQIAVYRGCKECRQFLLRTRQDEGKSRNE